MNKFKEFLAENNGKYVEVADTTNYAQCFDLVLKWTDYLGFPRSFNHLYAYSIFQNPTDLTKQNFDLIPNSLDGIPQEGDIVVWGKSYNGTAGHVGIATGAGDTKTFECFVQNDPIGSNSHIKNYNYNNVLGWLRAKNQNDPIDKQQQENIRKAVVLDRLLIWLKGADLVATDDSTKHDENTLIETIDKLKTDNTNHRNGYEEFKSKYNEISKEKEKWEDELNALKAVLENKNKDDLAKAEIDCQAKIREEKNRLALSYAIELNSYKEDINKLNQQLKKKTITIEKPLFERFKGMKWTTKLEAILEILKA